MWLRSDAVGVSIGRTRHEDVVSFLVTLHLLCQQFIRKALSATLIYIVIKQQLVDWLLIVSRCCSAACKRYTAADQADKRSRDLSGNSTVVSSHMLLSLVILYHVIWGSTKVKYTNDKKLWNYASHFRAKMTLCQIQINETDQMNETNHPCKIEMTGWGYLGECGWRRYCLYSVSASYSRPCRWRNWLVVKLYTFTMWGTKNCTVLFLQ